MPTLTGSYALPDGNPASGHIEIIPSAKVVIDLDGNVILSGRVKVPLDDEGSFSVDLPATDDATLNPTGFGYTVVTKLHHGGGISPATFQLPASPSTVDMSDVTPVLPSSLLPTYRDEAIAAAEEAAESATAADTSADAAAASASTASGHATTASAAATTATTQATNAAGSASAATGSASAAATSATAADASADVAADSAAAASTSAGAAAGSATAAATSATAAEAAADQVTGDVATHAADTTNVHGIVDTSALVLTNDARLTNARTPTAHTHPAGEVTGLATVATTGAYNDLSGKPTIPTVVTQPPLAAGQYFYPVSPFLTGTSATLGNGNLRLVPWVVTRATTIDRLAAEVTVVGDAASVLRLGIYSDNGAGLPSALLLDAGTIAGNSAAVQQVTISSTTLQPGVYWLGAVVQGVTTTQPTVRTISTSMNPAIAIPLGNTLPSGGGAITGVVQTGVTGALPASLASPVASGTAAPRVFARAA